MRGIAGQEFVELEVFVARQSELLAQRSVKTDRLLEEVIIMPPDDLGRRFMGALRHVQEVVGFTKNPKGVAQPDDFAVFKAEIFGVNAQPTGKEMRVSEKAFDRAGDQRPFTIEQGRHILALFGGNLGLIGKTLCNQFVVVFLHLQKGIDRIEFVRFLFEGADQGQVRDDKTGGRLGHNVTAEEPADQTVVEVEIGRQGAAAQRRAAKDIRERLITFQAILPFGQQQGNVRIVGAGHFVFHKDTGIRVDQADPLVVTDFAVDRL